MQGVLYILAILYIEKFTNEEWCGHVIFQVGFQTCPAACLELDRPVIESS
jgi:hypothetical protein